jgi:hypothetical protein
MATDTQDADEGQQALSLGPPVRARRKIFWNETLKLPDVELVKSTLWKSTVRSTHLGEGAVRMYDVVVRTSSRPSDGSGAFTFVAL